MRIILSLIIATNLVLFISSCTEEFPLDSRHEPQVFITGKLVHGADSVVVSVQKTVHINLFNEQSVNDASVALYTSDPAGQTQLITDSFEVTDGKYKNTNPISTVVGNSYWIEVTLSDGTSYSSTPELLKEIVPIKEITYTDGLARVHFHDPVDDANFYFVTYHFIENGRIVDIDTETSSDVLFNGNENAFIESDEIVFGTDLEAKIILEHITFNTYQFMLNAESQRSQQIGQEEGDGANQLFTPPPSNLTGNIRNNSNNQVALGNFSVIGIDSAISK